MSFPSIGTMIRKPLFRRKAIRFYTSIIPSGSLCFDIGANVGDRTDIFLALNASVVCVEPNEECLRVLQDRYSVTRDVTVVPLAVGEREGNSEIAICEEAPTLSTMSARWRSEGRFAKEHRWEKRQAVTVTTLDALITKYGLPRFCKVDVEGYELSVFRGLTRPIPYISFEFTSEFFDMARKCIDTLEKIGPLKLNCSFGESMKLLLPEWSSPEKLIRMMMPRMGNMAWGDIYVKFDERAYDSEIEDSG